MMRKAAAILAMTLVAVASVNAELKIVSRTSIRAATTAPAEPANLMLAMMGEMMVQLIVPNGPVEVTAPPC